MTRWNGFPHDVEALTAAGLCVFRRDLAGAIPQRFAFRPASVAFGIGIARTAPFDPKHSEGTDFRIDQIESARGLGHQTDRIHFCGTAR